MAKLQPDTGNRFINPYNFISPTRRVARETLRKGPLSGSISCTLTVRNELALPDHGCSTDRRYEFYRINGTPTVPGSEIKGCLRSVFEAITPSCFSVINTNVLTKRLSDPNPSVKPGILRCENGIWSVYKAERTKFKTEDSVARRWPEFNSGMMTTKYYRPCGTLPDYTCSDEELRDFAELLEIFLSYAKESNRRLFSDLQDRLAAEEDIVVFYRVENKALTYFSPAQVSRYMFGNTVSSLLGDHAAGICGADGQYCPACALFGTLGAGKPLASRVRFGDAKADRVVLRGTFVNLPELSSPKITSVEFYSKKSGAGYTDAVSWDYDSEGVSLNGRKFYYHGAPQTTETLGERSFATKTALKSSTFTFDIMFDRISETELRQLLWVITIGDNRTDSPYCHKLGAGKPAGYGSVKMTVNGISLRTFENGKYTVETKSFSDLEVTDALFRSEDRALREFRLISNVTYTDGRKISYPIADDGRGGKNSKAAHQWFSSNRLNGNRTRPAQFRYVLHPLSPDAAALELPAMTAARQPSDEDPRFRQSGGAQRTQAPGGEVKGIKCPHCGKFNFRCYKDSAQETKSWKQGVCFTCGGKLFG